ncbi:hypothetical protein ACGFZL_31670 [Streptomyces sp. NPDC048182]|uniref:hypothetical protein n=1 Tax=Streptomyces sp. NPDC048182 TaxID=3365507 RepID=UPI0037166EF5
MSERWQEHMDLPQHMDLLRATATGPRPRPEGQDMANKIEIRPLDKKETTGDSGGNGGS